MINVETFFKALKANWIHRINCAEPRDKRWVQVAHKYLAIAGNLQHIMNFTIDTNTKLDMLNSLPPFYRQSIQCYCESNNTITVEDFRNDILNQPIWGNQYITVPDGNRKKALFFRKWYILGIQYIKDLHFRNGKLDEASIFQTINSENILTKILLIKKALRPYQQDIINFSETQSGEISPKTVSTKGIYKKLIEMKCNIAIADMSNLVTVLCQNNNRYIKAFQCQLCNKGENVLQEFNFKVMHNILPCNVNLKRWHIVDDATCDLCVESQTIEHLLFSCSRATAMWQLFHQGYKVTLQFKDIVCGVEDSDIS